ncbi:MAG: hypothetical protein MHM6MM_003702 [Cercozoa sp. M6MM]
MSAVAPISKKTTESAAAIQPCRVILTSRKLKEIEALSRDLVSKCKAHDVEFKGPVRLPTKTLCITTRKAPSGNGTETWDRFEMRIHKRIIDLFCERSLLQQITKVTIPPSVKVAVNFS